MNVLKTSLTSSLPKALELMNIATRILVIITHMKHTLVNMVVGFVENGKHVFHGHGLNYYINSHIILCWLNHLQDTHVRKENQNGGEGIYVTNFRGELASDALDGERSVGAGSKISHYY